MAGFTVSHVANGFTVIRQHDSGLTVTLNGDGSYRHGVRSVLTAYNQSCR